MWFANSEADGLEAPPCGGLGVLHCYCGGDLCICGNYGEVPCPGCANCEPEWEEDLDETADDDDLPDEARLRPLEEDDH